MTFGKKKEERNNEEINQFEQDMKYALEELNKQWEKKGEITKYVRITRKDENLINHYVSDMLHLYASVFENKDSTFMKQLRASKAGSILCKFVKTLSGSNYRFDSNVGGLYPIEISTLQLDDDEYVLYQEIFGTETNGDEA